MDLAITTSQSEELVLECGESILVRPLKQKEWGQLQAWFKRTCPSPVTRALFALQQMKDSGESVSLEAEESLLDHAQRQALNWPPRVGSAPWFDAIVKAEGAVAQFLETVLSKADPEITRERCEALAPILSMSDLSSILRVALYGENPAAPKAEGPASRQSSGRTPTTLAS